MAMHDWLSSWTLTTKCGCEALTGITVCNSVIKLFRGMVSLRADDKAIYSASAVDSEISVCNLLCQYTGQFAYFITNPVLDYIVSASVEFLGS